MSRLLLKLVFLMFICPFGLKAQNKYFPGDPHILITSPRYLGPNALPVPLLHKAYIPGKFYWSGLYEYYSGRGDKTHDFNMHFIVPVANGRIGLEFKYVPVEFFSMDSAVSLLRRTQSGEAVAGHSFGDIYFGTMIQLIKDHDFLPDLAVAMSCRTASGTQRANARYVDTPGYYIDAAIGDSYGADKGYFRHIRWYAELGFYCWQTYLNNYPQNDALLFGCGIDFDFKSFFINQSIRGYSGYMNNGDQPLVYRADLGFKMGEAAFVVGYERGLNDYPFQSIRAGFQIGLTPNGD